MDDPQQLQEAGLGEIAASASPEALEQVRIKYLGRQGLVTGLMRGLGGLPVDERRSAGARFNALKDTISEDTRLAASSHQTCRVTGRERTARQPIFSVLCFWRGMSSLWMG
jgi:phenylalanyl-tRNA synthetase alpha subunit